MLVQERDFLFLLRGELLSDSGGFSRRSREGPRQIVLDTVCRTPQRPSAKCVGGFREEETGMLDRNLLRGSEQNSDDSFTIGLRSFRRESRTYAHRRFAIRLAVKKRAAEAVVESGTILVRLHGGSMGRKGLSLETGPNDEPLSA